MVDSFKGKLGASKPKTAPGARTATTRPVLVVDDESMMRSLLTEVLKLAHFEPTAVEDGESAVKILESREFGVAIIDKNLPGMSGLDVLTAARKCAPMMNCIIFTGFPSKESAIEALKLGAFDYIEKPVDNDLLVAQIERAWNAYVNAALRDELFHKYETLFEIVPGIVWFMTEEGVLKRINREGAAMLGYAPEDLLEKPYALLLRPDEQDQVAHWAFTERRTGPRGTRRQVITLKTKEGATRLFEICSTGAYDRLVDQPTKRFWGTLGVGLDITEHARLEAQLHQARKMEAIGRLAGGIAHDFNNLLAVILNNTEFVMETLPADHGCQVDLGEVQYTAKRAADLTRQLLSFSRKQVVHPRAIDVGLALKSIEPILRRVLSEQIELCIKTAPDLSPVNADPTQLDQVLLNLALNAADAMPNGGTLTIHASMALIDREIASTHVDVATGPYVLLSVTDTGIGMSPEVREHLFEPFFTTKEPGSGTGLGLATVYGIVTHSGGHIEVESVPGRGTTVKVYLPAKEGKAEQAESPMVLTRKAGHERVLVVEDEALVRRLARRILERAGYLVVEADHGEAAIALAESRNDPFDLLLADIVMPRMSGPELAERLRQRKPDLCVVFMSGYVGETTRQAPVHPLTAFLQKPFSTQGMLSVVRELLDRQKIDKP